MIDYTCGKCGAAMSSPDSLVGQLEPCPECDTMVAVPKDLQQTPPQQPKAGPSGSIRHFHSKVAGVTHANPNGINRQDLLPILTPGEELLIEPEPENLADRQAIRLVRKVDDVQIGYVKRELCKEIHQKLRNGWTIRAFVHEVTGGEGSAKNFGCNIVYGVGPPGTTPDAVGDHVANSVPFPRKHEQTASGCSTILLTALAIAAAICWMAVN